MNQTVYYKAKLDLRDSGLTVNGLPSLMNHFGLTAAHVDVDKGLTSTDERGVFALSVTGAGSDALTRDLGKKRLTVSEDFYLK